MPPGADQTAIRWHPMAAPATGNRELAALLVGTGNKWNSQRDSSSVPTGPTVPTSRKGPRQTCCSTSMSRRTKPGKTLVDIAIRFADSRAMDQRPRKPVLNARRLMSVRSGWQDPEDVARAYMLRGAILSSVSHIELCIARLALRASYVPAYDEIAAKWKSLPPTTTQRVEFLYEVLQVDGPLGPYAGWLKRSLGRWEAIRAIRNTMAHGHLTVFAGGPIRVHEIVAMRSELTQGYADFRGAQLETIALRYARFSRICQRLSDRASGSDFLPTIDDAVAFHEGR